MRSYLTFVTSSSRTLTLTSVSHCATFPEGLTIPYTLVEPDMIYKSSSMLHLMVGHQCVWWYRGIPHLISFTPQVSMGACLSLIQCLSIGSGWHNICHTPSCVYVVLSVLMALPYVIVPVQHSICHTSSHTTLVPSTVLTILVSTKFSENR